MKKRFKFFLTILLVASLVFSFVSCSDLFAGSSTANVSFSLNLPKEFFASRNAQSDVNAIDETKSKITITLYYDNGDKIDEKEDDIEEGKKVKISFDSIPVGSTVYAIAEADINGVQYKGETEPELIKRGVNTLKLQLKMIPKDDDEDDDPADPEIELKIETTDISVTQGESATFIATEGFDSYYWECGNQSNSENNNNFTVDTTNLLSGKYIVKLIVTKGTNEYSAEAILVVEAKSGEVTSDITINQLEVKITAETSYEIGELILTATEGFDNYIWEVMGEQSPIASNNSFTVNIRNLQLQGSYVIRVIATDKNGNEYSDEYIYCPAV